MKMMRWRWMRTVGQRHDSSTKHPLDRIMVLILPLYYSVKVLGVWIALLEDEDVDGDSGCLNHPKEWEKEEGWMNEQDESWGPRALRHFSERRAFST